MLKNRFKKEDNESVTKCNQLKYLLYVKKIFFIHEAYSDYQLNRYCHDKRNKH